MAKIYLTQPCYGSVELESCDAIDKAMGADTDHEILITRLSSSLLANGFNALLGTALEAGDFDYFVMLHSDVAPSDNWLEVLIAELEMYKLDVLHAPCALKNGKGLTSTAAAYSDDRFAPVRRLTTTELQQIWPTFTAQTLREQLDARIKHLLPNTGCMIIRMGDWLNDFPGFEIRDRLVRDVAPSGRPRWRADVVSEDWNFGYWCGENGFRVGGTTKVKTRHIGRVPFMTEIAWGSETRDETFYELTDVRNREAA